MPRHRQASGFSLIELLVSVSLLVLLIALLMPVLRQAREAGRRMECLSHLRTLALTTLSYAQDNRRYWPPATGTFRNSYYLRQWHYFVFFQMNIEVNGYRDSYPLQCPTLTRTAGLDPIQVGYSYAINGMLASPGTPNVSARLGTTLYQNRRLTFPQETALYLDCLADGINVTTITGHAASQLPNVAMRHADSRQDRGSSFTVVYTDGHAEIESDTGLATFGRYSYLPAAANYQQRFARFWAFE